MKDNNSYFGGFFKGTKSLCIGLKTTMREFFTKKITEQYPENRKELKMFERFRTPMCSLWSVSDGLSQRYHPRSERNRYYR